MRLVRSFLVFGALTVSASALAGQQGKRAFEIRDWYELHTVSAPAMSPDGSRIAFTVQTVNEKDNKYHREVWVVPTSGGEPRRFTSPGTESSNPRWSHDGTLLVFTSQRPGGKGSTWMLRMDQPGGEAFQDENYPRGESVPSSGRFAVWSDADSVVRDTTRKDPYARMQPMARPPYGAITKPLDPARFDGRHVYDMRYKSNNQGFVPGPREARSWRPAQIWVQGFDGTPKRKITDTRYSHRNVTVSPDGRWVAFTADAALRPDSVVDLEQDSIARLPYDRARDDVDRNDMDIYVIPIAGGTPRKIASHFGNEGNLRWSPDSRRLAFVAAPGRTKSDRVWAVNLSGGTPENLLGDWKYEPQSIEWLADGGILMTAMTGGSSGVFRIDLSTKRLTQLMSGRRRMAGVSTNAHGGGTQIAFVASSVTRPTELYVVNANGSGERKLTSFNQQVLDEVAFSDAERFLVPSVGGRQIESWLMKPHGYEAGKKYPVVLYIHGGPHALYGENWFDEFQNLAAAGMFVLYTNPRGSSGYGADFTFASRGQWGGDDYLDLMNAVDVVARRPDVDSTRMGVTGGSYGGFMTAWITTKTNRFKAAQADRMISDWLYWYGASDAQGLTEFEFFGKPWDNWAMYDTLSPIRHVHKVRTPTLIVQSEEDHRTPMGNAEIWFIALKKQGVPVELIRYPRSTHELSRSGEPWLLVDRLGRLRQWFTYWLKHGSAATAAATQ
ncbi:MAG: S9 family peptidase [Gemmatimonadaceae bacterium]